MVAAASARNAEGRPPEMRSTAARPTVIAAVFMSEPPSTSLLPRRSKRYAAPGGADRKTRDRGMYRSRAMLGGLAKAVGSLLRGVGDLVGGLFRGLGGLVRRVI